MRVRDVAAACALVLACSLPTQPAGTVATPPGADPFPVELQRKLTNALRAKGRAYEPRTRHRREDGSPVYTNRLVLESSPYLLQHAHNPVNWYPWGDEAFETAARLGRPVLLSIGYSTCHWCHVMEEESFEDEEIAAYLNTHYVAIKVDREERPDIDAVYMNAVQLMSGHGGWPMTTWLTPERKPFYGGTYFPARDGDRGARRGFLTLLADLKRLYENEPETIEQRATELSGEVAALMEPGPGGELPGAPSLERAVASYRSMFDPVNGGLRRPQKFPSSLPIRLLLREHRRTGDGELLEMARLTLLKMAHGGLYDQVGGGFHRYTVDASWLVPHFEKMLYDNALLTVAYLEGYQASGSDEMAQVAREVLDYLGREMTSPEGGFYAATDADSPAPGGEREEGRFFTWTLDEMREVLDERETRAAAALYGVSSQGNFEGRNILHRPRPLEAVARELGTSGDELRGTLARAREKLYRRRLARPAPLCDDKILTSWNGLAISAFARGGFVLDDPELTGRAERAAKFVLGRLRENGRLRRSFKGGEARHNAYLDDYAFLIAGLLDLHETTSEPEWLREALALQAIQDRHYADRAGGGYFMTSDDHERLLAREKPGLDGAEPSGNSVALLNLLRLHELTTDDRYRRAARSLLEAFSPVLERHPTALAEMLVGLDFLLSRPREVVLVTGSDRADAEPFLEVLRTTFLPHKVLVTAAEGDDLRRKSELVPLVRGKVARDGKPTAYVCESGTCRLPTTDARAFAEQLTDTPQRSDPGKTGAGAIDSGAESR